MLEDLSKSGCKDWNLDEPLLATAIEQSIFWVVELPAPWPSKLVETPALGARGHATLAALGSAHSRIQWVRSEETVRGCSQSSGSGHSRARLFGLRFSKIGRPGLEAAIVFEPGWEEMGDEAIEQARIWSLGGAAIPDKAEDAGMLRWWMVCTHGKRDRCCARAGLPTYAALKEQAADDGCKVWQTSHLGGHRFAATLVVLPSGVMYGRVPPQEDAAAHLLALDAQDEIASPWFRGIVGWPRWLQAALGFALAKTDGSKKTEAAFGAVAKLPRGVLTADRTSIVDDPENFSCRIQLKVDGCALGSEMVLKKRRLVGSLRAASCGSQKMTTPWVWERL